MSSESSWPKRSARGRLLRDQLAEARGCWRGPVSSSVTACSETSSCSAMFSIDGDGLPDQVQEDVALGGAERPPAAGDGHHPHGAGGSPICRERARQRADAAGACSSRARPPARAALLGDRDASRSAWLDLPGLGLGSHRGRSSAIVPYSRPAGPQRRLDDDLEQAPGDRGRRRTPRRFGCTERSISICWRRSCVASAR